MSAQQLAILGIEDHLHEAIPSAGSRSLARCGKWELAHLHLVSGLDGLLLGKTNRCHLGRGVGTSGDDAVVNRMHVHAGNLLHAADTLGRCHVGKRWPCNDIADGVHPLYVGAVELINNHLTALVGHAYLLKAQAFEVGGDTHCR